MKYRIHAGIVGGFLRNEVVSEEDLGGPEQVQRYIDLNGIKPYRESDAIPREADRTLSPAALRQRAEELQRAADQARAAAEAATSTEQLQEGVGTPILPEGN